VVDDLKITYPSEVTQHTGLSAPTVLARLGYMKNQGILERVSMRQGCPDDLKARLPDLWAWGLKGDTLKRMSWYRRVKHEADKKE
jgi:DNA-binding Lrp family transcriptional regulator